MVDWLELSASLVKSLAWPAAVVVAVAVLRKHVGMLLQRLLRVKVSGVELELDGAEKAGEALKLEPPSVESEWPRGEAGDEVTPTVGEGAQLEDVSSWDSGESVPPAARLAQRAFGDRVPGDPVGTVVAAWASIERAIRDYVSAVGWSPRGRTLTSVVKALADEGRLAANGPALFAHLKNLRELVVIDGVPVSEGQAAGFAELAELLVSSIDFQTEHAKAHGPGFDPE